MSQETSTARNSHAKRELKGENRPKYIRGIIASVNAELRNRKVKDEGDPLFNWACRYLISHRCYDGFILAADRPLPDGTTAVAVQASEYDYEYLRIL